jgi:hypothetical protein
MTQLHAHVRLAVNGFSKVNGRAIFAPPLAGKTATPDI